MQLLCFKVTVPFVFDSILVCSCVAHWFAHYMQLLQYETPGGGGVWTPHRDVSCKQNVKVEVKLINFIVGFGLGLDFFDCL